MRIHTALFAFLGLALAACGDDGGGGGIDAPKMIDAAPDAPPPSALGQICNASMPCPAAAPDCITFGAMATQGICSLLCHAAAQIMTDANAQPASGTNLTPDHPKCTAIFTGTAGMASCGLPVNRMPAGALQPNTTYTYDAYCAIQCGVGNTCPTGLTCMSGICRV